MKLQICRTLSSDFSDGWGEFVAWWCGLVIYFCFGVAVLASVFSYVAEEVGGVYKIVEVFVVLAVPYTHMTLPTISSV